MTIFQYGQAQDERHGDRDGWLYVVVDADNGRTQGMLCNHCEDVTEVRATEDHVEGLHPRLHRYTQAYGLDDVVSGEWQDHERGPQEHPLIDREDAVTLDERIEQTQVERVGELSSETQQVASEVAFLVAQGVGTGSHQDQCTYTADEDTAYLHAGELLLEDDGREDHRKDRHRGGDDAGIDRRGEAEADGVAALVEAETEQASSSKAQFIAHRHMLFLDKERGEPEKDGTTQDAEGHHRNAIEAVGHGVLAKRSHQAPECTRTCHGQVRYDQSFSFLIHVLS